jgi:DNA-binding transcriptional ArsR family regulator
MSDQLENIKETVSLFKIFSDYTRLRIIELLTQDEYCVQDISDTLETSQSAISHQLKLLRDLNVVKTRKQGKQVFYSLQDEHVKEIFLMGYKHATDCR